MMDVKNRYFPDYVIHPGEYLEEVLESREIQKRDFAERSGLSMSAVNQIINGKSIYSSEVAFVLEKILDIHADVWMNMAAAYHLPQT